MSSGPKKKWGQNFLRNRAAVTRIVAAVEPAPGELIVEIGPGEGALTEEVARLGAEWIAYEIDSGGATGGRAQHITGRLRSEASRARCQPCADQSWIHQESRPAL